MFSAESDTEIKKEFISKGIFAYIVKDSDSLDLLILSIRNCL